MGSTKKIKSGKKGGERKNDKERDPSDRAGARSDPAVGEALWRSVHSVDPGERPSQVLPSKI